MAFERGIWRGSRVAYGGSDLAELASSYYSLPPGFGFEQNLQSQLIGRAIGGVIDVVAGMLLVFGRKAWRLSWLGFEDRWATSPKTTMRR